jgi:hypothetical protein
MLNTLQAFSARPAARSIRTPDGSSAPGSRSWAKMRQLRPHSSRFVSRGKRDKNEINRIFRFGLSELLFHAAQLSLHRLPFKFYVVHHDTPFVERLMMNARHACL